MATARQLPVPIAAHAPHDAAAEWLLMRSLCLGGTYSNEALDAIHAARLQPDELTEPPLRDYMERALALDAKGDPVDEVTITLGVDDLGLRDTLDAVNLRLLGMTYTDSDPAELVARIRQANALRLMQSRAFTLNIALRRPDVTVSSALTAMRDATADAERLAASTADAAAADDGIWRPQTQELTDLMTEQLPATRWLVENLIPEGLLLLAAKAKYGKTSLMCHMCASIAAGAPALGQLATERCEILYVAAEDNHRRMQRRMQRMLRDTPAPRGFHIEYRWPRLDQGGLQALDTYCDEHPAVGMIVLDTLERVRAARRYGGGYEDDYAAVAGLQSLAARHQVAIVVLHHLRKASADDPFDEINATMGLLASVDNMLVMRRGQDGVTELHRRGREYVDDEALALKGDRDTLCWQLAGVLADVTRSEARNTIIDLLRKHPGGMGPTEISTELGKNLSTIKTLLGRLVDEQKPVVTTSDGRYFAGATGEPR